MTSASKPPAELTGWVPAGLYDCNLDSPLGPPTLVPAPLLLDQLQLQPQRAPAATEALRIGVHLHAHYLPESLRVLSILERALPAADLLITTDSPEKRQTLEKQLQNSSATTRRSRIAIKLVANRGRNVLPLLQEGLPFLASNDLALHLHGKRSGDPHLGQAWLSQMLDSLVSDASWCNGINNLFAAEPRLGLLMPRPPEVLRPFLGWGSNRDLAEQLVQQLWPGRRLPLQAPLVFPAGMMFWFRPDALSSWHSAAAALEPLEPEPIPCDGTSLHAIERLTAHACEQSGFMWALIGPSQSQAGSWQPPISVWRDEPTAHQQAITNLSDQYRQLKGEVLRLQAIEQDLHADRMAVKTNYAQHVTALETSHNAHIAALKADYQKHIATLEADYHKQIDAIQAEYDAYVAEILLERDTAKQELSALQQTSVVRLLQRLQRLRQHGPSECDR